MITNILNNVIADAETKVVVYIFVLLPILLGVLFVLFWVIAGIATLFGYRVPPQDPD